MVDSSSKIARLDGVGEQLEYADIAKYLPHRYPFMLIDRITHLDTEAGVASGYKNVSANEPFFQGHFPGHPIMPGVLIIEAMAQLVGVIAFKRRGFAVGGDHICYLAGLDKARFKRPVVPGDRLDMDVAITHERSLTMKCRGSSEVAGEAVCSVEILLQGVAV